MKFLVLIACIAMPAVFAASSLTWHPRMCVTSKSIPIWTQCLQDLFKKAKPYLINGVEELNLPSLNPYELKDFNAKLKLPGIMDMDIQIHNLVAHGFEKGDLKKISFDPIANSATLVFNIPHLKFKSSYHVQGDLLGKQIDDSGKGESKLENLILSFTGTHKIINKSGVDYVQLQDLKLKPFVESGNAKVVSQDPTLQISADILVGFFNDNPQRLITLAHSLFGEISETFIKNQANSILLNVPANEILPQ